MILSRKLEYSVGNKRCAFAITTHYRLLGNEKNNGSVSNRLKYRSSLGSGSAIFIFSGLLTVQVFFVSF